MHTKKKDRQFFLKSFLLKCPFPVVAIGIFKLQQMQKVDEGVLDRLIDRFVELDAERTGTLVLGVEAPNKEQVAEMKLMTEDTGMTLQEAWRKHLSGNYKLRTDITFHSESTHSGGGGGDDSRDLGDMDLNIATDDLGSALSEPPLYPDSIDSKVNSASKSIGESSARGGRESLELSDLAMPLSGLMGAAGAGFEMIPNPFASKDGTAL